MIQLIILFLYRLRLQRELPQQVLPQRELLQQVLEQIKAFVLRFHGDEYAVQQMLAYKKQATEALSVFRDSATKTSLLNLLDYAINRVQ